MLEKLRERGVDLQFSRLRWRWYQGIVAENVRFGRPDEPRSPKLSLSSAELQLNRRALLRLQLQVDSLILHKGRLSWPLTATNGALRELSVENIQTELRLLPNDLWALDDFRAQIAGGRVQLSGFVTNASAIRSWTFFQTRRPTRPGALQSRLNALAEALETIHFAAPPHLNLDIRGDARDPQSFNIRMGLKAPGSTTPWGEFESSRFSARLFPATNHEPARAEITLQAAAAQTRWGTTTNLHLTIHLATAQTTNLVAGELSLRADTIRSEWITASPGKFAAKWTHSLTNAVPLSGTGELECKAVQTRWGKAGSLRLRGELATANVGRRQSNSSWAWWADIEPYPLDFDCTLEELEASKLQAQKIVCAGSWRAPSLTITNAQLTLFGAAVEANAGLDVGTRVLNGNVSSSIDPHKLAPLLTEGAQQWLSQYSWDQPPVVKAATSLILPAWTNQHPDWRGEVRPTLQLQGEFQIDDGGAYRELPFSTARSHFSYSNMVWRLPDLAVTRPEGKVDASLIANDRTKDYYFHIRSSIDPRIVRPLLATNQLRGFDLLSFTTPPVIDGQIWGRWHEPERIGMDAEVAVTNISFRNETLTDFQSRVQYTNRCLQLKDPMAHRGAQQLSASGLFADFRIKKIYVTNGFSTADPGPVARAITAKVGRIMEPYHFTYPPTVFVQGVIPMGNEEDADLRFQVTGGPFEWLRFHSPHVEGQVHWVGRKLTLDNVRADLYGGKATGSARFDFRPEQGNDFQFEVTATNASLRALISDWGKRTNNLEGKLSGTIIINSANSGDWRTWQGGGDVQLRDGLLWDIPIFGVFSPILNGIFPGLGNSRVTAGTGNYSVTNGVIRSEDLEFRSTMMRLDYHGTADLQGQVDARVEAELLRDAWVVGPLISTVFWPVTKLFEYRVSGTLNEPKTEPLYFIPKIVLLPFHPFRTLKEMLPDEPSKVTPLTAPKK
jgi:hypothetical protein